VGVVLEKAVENFKNEMAKNMRESFNKECPEEEKGKYNSKEFKDKCDELFKKADTDGNGTLDAKELKKTVADILGADADSQSELILLAFDENHDSKLEEDEFFELMKYCQWTKDKAAKAAEELKAKAKEMREAFDKECPEEVKAKYTSPEFKVEMDKLFDISKINKKDPLQVALGESFSGCGFEEALLLKAFDANNDSKLDKDEFLECMKYLNWAKIKAKGDAADAKAKEENAKKAPEVVETNKAEEDVQAKKTKEEEKETVETNNTEEQKK